MIKSVVILVVMILINLALVFAIVRLVKRTNENMQKFFLDRASEFFPTQEKQTEAVIQEEEETVEKVKVATPLYVTSDVNTASYKSEDFKDQYKNVKNEMNFDKDDVILDVVDSNIDDINNLTEAIKKINESFDFDTIYELSTVDIVKQLEILNDVFDSKQKQVLNNYLKGIEGKKFDITAFFSYIKEQAKLTDENFYVKTGTKDETFDDLGGNIVTVHDDNIVEGIKVVHKNKMYDYSI